MYKNHSLRKAKQTLLMIGMSLFKVTWAGAWSRPKELVIVGACFRRELNTRHNPRRPSAPAPRRGPPPPRTPPPRPWCPAGPRCWPWRRRAGGRWPGRRGSSSRPASAGVPLSLQTSCQQPSVSPPPWLRERRLAAPETEFWFNIKQIWYSSIRLISAKIGAN